MPEKPSSPGHRWGSLQHSLRWPAGGQEDSNPTLDPLGLAASIRAWKFYTNISPWTVGLISPFLQVGN